jgi:DNA-binding transcriptional ArsR family regulator
MAMAPTASSRARTRRRGRGSRRARGTYTIRRPAQLRALSSPARQEIVDALGALGPASIADLAAHLGRRPQALYYHVRALQRAGLVLQAGTRRVGRSDGGLFVAAGQRLAIGYDLSSPGFVARMRVVLASLLRLTQRDVLRALHQPFAVTDGPARNLWCGRLRMRLTRTQLIAVNRLFHALVARLSDHAGQRQGRIHAVTLAIVPLSEA